MIDFTQEQLEAIETNDKHLRIIACAGSGKTSTVAGKVVHLLNPKNGLNVLPKNIIAFTYTEKAAAELKNRILKFIKEVPELENLSGLADMYVGTIHGWCLKALQENEYDYRKFSVLDDIKLRLFVDKNYEIIGMKDITKIGNGSVNMKIFTDTGKFIQLMNIIRESKIQGELPENIKIALEKYKSTLKANCYFDFTMIMEEAVDRFDNKKELYKKIQEDLKYLIVDEYQDINPIQYRLISKLYQSSNAKITVVGDDDQNIYQWRGSNSKFIKEFRDIFKPSTEVKLEKNYRSSSGITTLAEKIIERNERIPKKMISADKQEFVKKEDVLFNLFDTIPEENEFIASTIQNLVGTYFKDENVERGLDYSDFAVLLRAWSKATQIVETFEQRGIPYITAGVNQLFETPEVSAARAIFHFLDKSISEDELRQQWLLIRRNSISEKKLNYAIEKLKEEFPELNVSSKGVINYDYNLQQIYWDFIQRAEITEEVFQDNIQAEIRMFNLGKFSQVIYDFEFINFASSKPTYHLFNFLNFIRYAAVDYYPEGWLNNPYKTPRAVQIMTVHQAKGLEFPAVFIPGLNKNYLPAKKPGGLNEWHFLPKIFVENQERYEGTVEDERRLFYVALTRPQKYLFISRAPDLDNQLYRKPSEFVHEISEVDDIVVSHIPDFGKKRKLVPEPKERAVNISLSFSILKDYFECPYRFKLVSMYGFLYPLNRRMGFGKSMHDSLMELHKRIKRDKKFDNEDEPIKIAERQSHFPYMGTSILLNEMVQDVKDKVLEYYQKNKETFDSIEFVEQEILLNLDDGILVNGRIDLIRKKNYEGTYETTIIEFKSDDDPQSSKITLDQLKLYGLGHKELTGHKADYIQIYNIKTNKKESPHVLEDKHLEEMQEKIHKAATEIRNQYFNRIDIKEVCLDCLRWQICSSGIKFKK